MKKILLIGTTLFSAASYVSAMNRQPRSDITSRPSYSHPNSAVSIQSDSGINSKPVVRIISKIRRYAINNSFNDIRITVSYMEDTSRLSPRSKKKILCNIIEFQLEVKDTVDNINADISSAIDPKTCNIQITGSELQKDIIFDYMNKNIEPLLILVKSSYPRSEFNAFLRFLQKQAKGRELDAKKHCLKNCEFFLTLEKCDFFKLYETLQNNLHNPENVTNKSTIIYLLINNLIVSHKFKIINQWIKAYADLADATI